LPWRRGATIALLVPTASSSRCHVEKMTKVQQAEHFIESFVHPENQVEFEN
jgi:hypothetical protein